MQVVNAGLTLSLITPTIPWMPIRLRMSIAAAYMIAMFLMIYFPRLGRTNAFPCDVNDTGDWS
jgi:hypothetical protein